MTRILLLVALFAAGTAQAQHHTPYAGQQDRAIKALSEDETKQYLAGAGMGYARAAELNGYPGPMHVLELADDLSLTTEQRIAAKRLMDAHKEDARAIGARRVEVEKRLDALFRAGKPDERTLAETVRASAAIEGEYRLSHLETHRRMKALLSDEQVKRYAQLRGYSTDEGSHKH